MKRPLDITDFLDEVDSQVGQPHHATGGARRESAGIRTFHVHRVVGTGGFGTVLFAVMRTPEGFEKCVALKVLKPGVPVRDEMARRLRDEARMLGLVRHRAIVRTDGLVYLAPQNNLEMLVRNRGTRPLQAIVMDYVHGIDLAELTDRSGPVPVGPALEIVAEVAAALDAAWNSPGVDGRPLRLLHRDVKPGNIKLTAAGETMLLDLGIARADFAGREAKTQLHFFATLEYSSPERLQHENGPESDVYALAAVAYELIMGHQLGQTSPDRATHTASMVRVMARMRAEGHPPAVANLLGKALAWARETRWTAAEFAREAEAVSRVVGGPTLRNWARSAVEPALPALDVVGTPTMVFREWRGSIPRHLGDVALLAPQLELTPRPPTPRAGATMANPTHEPRPTERWMAGGAAMVLGFVVTVLVLIVLGLLPSPGANAARDLTAGSLEISHERGP